MLGIWSNDARMRQQISQNNNFPTKSRIAIYSFVKCFEYILAATNEKGKHHFLCSALSLYIIIMFCLLSFVIFPFFQIKLVHFASCVQKCLLLFSELRRLLFVSSYMFLMCVEMKQIGLILKSFLRQKIVMA